MLDTRAHALRSPSPGLQAWSTEAQDVTVKIEHGEI